MKRSEMPRPQKPLARRTPLQSQQELLARSGRLRFRSAKTEQVYRKLRRALVSMLLAANPICQRCLANPATEVHEIKSRARGGSITDPHNCVALCHDCHDWITNNPAEALADGWLKNSWEDA